MQVLEQIRQQRPQYFYIAADGPRGNRPGEAQQCAITREQVLKGIDWPCQVRTLFREENLGCGKAVSSAIDWFFSQVEEGIILEDDCIPAPGFFSFCTRLLEHYRHDTSVMHINGSNYQAGIQRGEASYYFSRYSHIWGWATWKRAWQRYDFTLLHYRNASREGMNEKLLQDVQAIYDHAIDTWDIQWFMTVWFNKGLAVTPNVCLVRNIGYGKDATHTRHMPGWFRKIVYGDLEQITHPAVKAINRAADDYTEETIFGGNKLLGKVKRIVKENKLLYHLYKRIYS